MRCVSCGEADMVLDTRDINYTYKGESTTIPEVVGEYCPVCGESIHDEAESTRVNELMLEFNKEVNSSIVDPEFINKVRKKLKLGQKEAASIFGGGANGFSRYENGKVKPPLALVQLLRLLNNHPELLDELRPKTNTPKRARAIRRKKLSELAPTP